MVRLLIPFLILTASHLVEAHDAEWPQPDPNQRPIVRWWWPADLPARADPVVELERFADAGFGGVEIHPTGPARGGPAEQLAWLSPAWMARLQLTYETAVRLGLRVDLASNDNPSGGLPALAPYESAYQTIPILAEAEAGPLRLELPPGEIDCLGAWPSHGRTIDLLPFIDGETRQLVWDAPPGKWQLFGIGREPLEFPDPFSPTNATNVLNSLSTSLDALSGTPRALGFTLRNNDADWSSTLVPAFQRHHGYDLREELPALFGEAKVGAVERVFSDYRETLAALQLVTLKTWHQWTSRRGSSSRLYLDGIVGNPVDLLGTAEVPAMIVRGLPKHDERPLLAFASSAAHTGLKPLVAATAFSYPDDAERLTPKQMKEWVDLLWLAGANQVVLDGILSEPEGELFPPSQTPPMTPLGPGSGRLQNLRPFNDYITRCQSILQSGAADSDILLYYPFHDLNTQRGGIPKETEKQSSWFIPTAFHRTATALREGGIQADYVTDLGLRNAGVDQGKITLGGMNYQTIVLAEIRQLPEETANMLLKLSRLGATITVLGEWPTDVPGLAMPDIRRGTLFNALQSISESQLIEGDDPVETIIEAGVRPEPMRALGLECIRRRHSEGHHYFVVNRSNQRFSGWVPLSVSATSAVEMDPRFLRRSGKATSRMRDGTFELHLTLEAGESRILRTFTERSCEAPTAISFQPSGHSRTIGEAWKVEFVEGGPELPDGFETPLLGSWTSLTDPRAERFQGTARYTTEFEIPYSGSWLLNLGRVESSARVFIDGKLVGASFAPPHLLDITRFVSSDAHRLQIEVTNLRQPRAGNDGPSKPSGLFGPVRITPVSEPVGERNAD